MEDITVEELYNKLQNNSNDFFFLDVREQEEFDQQNLGATLIPLGTLPIRLADLITHKNSEIVIHCRSGARSHQAKLFLQQQGFKKVRNLLGGILEYNSKFGPVK